MTTLKAQSIQFIDAIAFLDKDPPIDQQVRNFIELAERKESVLRIAKMLSYNAKRNKPSKGLLKFNVNYRTIS